MTHPAAIRVIQERRDARQRDLSLESEALGRQASDLPQDVDDGDLFDLDGSSQGANEEHAPDGRWRPPVARSRAGASASSITNRAYAAIKQAAGITDRGLLHRFRDTIKTRMSEHGISERVSEHILGHVVPGIAGTYDHAEMLTQRREALAWWDEELDRILRKAPRTQPANVVPITTADRREPA